MLKSLLSLLFLGISIGAAPLELRALPTPIAVSTAKSYLSECE
jgi:hypothetical protein